MKETLNYDIHYRLMEMQTYQNSLLSFLVNILGDYIQYRSQAVTPPDNTGMHSVKNKLSAYCF